MLTYILAGAALKFLSIAPGGKRAYRFMGNTVGATQRMRRGLISYYVDRAKTLWDLCKKYHIVQAGDQLLELGTGWIPWESTIIRLFYDVCVALFDVWDNRQLSVYKQYCRQFECLVDREFDLDEQERERVHALLNMILTTDTFDQIYQVLGFQYLINPSGTLNNFQSESFAMIFSYDVLEHVNRAIVPELIRDWDRLLKPGGYAIHQFDLGDHLACYDGSVSKKNYLRYSDRTWRRYFENDIQYFNRIQRSEWLRFFEEAEMELIEEELVYEDVGEVQVDETYGYLSEQDLACIGMRVVLRKRVLEGKRE